ncbi:MAG: hypothetical protein Q4B70_19305 [Lachnospiraceae bacterium]|nr:hypothetical protein [Lachnospiraceae bacterium]
MKEIILNSDDGINEIVKVRWLIEWYINNSSIDRDDFVEWYSGEYEYVKPEKLKERMKPTSKMYLNVNEVYECIKRFQIPIRFYVSIKNKQDKKDELLEQFINQYKSNIYQKVRLFCNIKEYTVSMLSKRSGFSRPYVDTILIDEESMTKEERYNFYGDNKHKLFNTLVFNIHSILPELALQIKFTPGEEIEKVSKYLESNEKIIKETNREFEAKILSRKKRLEKKLEKKR